MAGEALALAQNGAGSVVLEHVVAGLFHAREAIRSANAAVLPHEGWRARIAEVLEDADHPIASAKPDHLAPAMLRALGVPQKSAWAMVNDAASSKERRARTE